jgi:trehalose 6-phosphate phosphatase
VRYLFSSSGLRNLEAFCYSKCLFAFDYDGTLAKIVLNPSEAWMSKITEKLLAVLNQNTQIAIISGRSLADLKKLLKINPRHIIGNHGLEGLPKTQFSNEVALDACKKWKKALAKTVRQDLGIQLEDKHYSLALHYRRSRLKKEAKANAVDSASKLHPPPRVIMGKYVVNLVPSGAPHKGVALMELMIQQGLSCAIYVGDDDTDEDVFGLPESRIMTIRVGKKIDSHARFFLKRQSEINRLIKQMLTFSGGVK